MSGNGYAISAWAPGILLPHISNLYTLFHLIVASLVLEFSFSLYILSNFFNAFIIIIICQHYIIHALQ